MRIPKNADLRVRRTITSIHSAFSTLARNTALEKITVLQLCKTAGINRKTFYRYYDDINDLLNEIKDELLTEYLQRVEGTTIPEDLPKITREFFTFCMEKGEGFDRIIAQNPHNLIRYEFVHNIMHERWHNSQTFTHYSDIEKGMIIAFAISTGIEIYSQWVITNKQLPMEKAIDIYTKLLTGGINAVVP
ncbi:MAG: TetR/AcrR family transcriptional regulator [Actinomycetaceae bacterium]|nr:TetR/AcrR family transcriptional regulator [Actinomycetaceae bacterium]